jgi:hypothetical protein
MLAIGHLLVLGLAPQPDALRLRVARVADPETVVTLHAQQLVEQEGFAAPVGANDDDGGNRPLQLPQQLQALLLD